MILKDSGGVITVKPASSEGVYLEASLEGVGRVTERCLSLKVESPFSVDGIKFIRAATMFSTMAESRTALIFRTKNDKIVHLLSKNSKQQS